MNSEIEKLFVPYEIALKLKEKGFNELSIAYYEDGYDIFNFGHAKGQLYNNDRFLISAPLYQQVLEWMKAKHNIFIEPFTSFMSPRKNVTIFRVQKYGKVYRDITAKTLKEAIEISIKLIK